MQKYCMAKESLVTRSEFFSEPVAEQRAFYNWMTGQVNEIVAGPYWFGDDPDTSMVYGGYEI